MKSKTLLIVTVSVLLAALLTGGVYSAVNFLHGSSNSQANSLVADDDLTPGVSEEFDGEQKSDVIITIPKTDYSVYVRAAIVVNWQKEVDDETFIYPVAPVKGTDGDYKLVLDSDKWFEKDGFYYYEEAVPGTGSGATEVLIGSCEQLKNPPEGYILHVEVLTQTIQAIGTTDADSTAAVTDAWGVSVTNGKLDRD